MRQFLLVSSVVVLAASFGFGQVSPVLRGPAGSVTPAPAASVRPASVSPPAAASAAAGAAHDPSLHTIATAVAAVDPLATALHMTMPIDRAIEASPRMQRLRTLTFNRKPAAILQAWRPQETEGAKDPATAASGKPRKTPEELKLDKEIEQFQRAVTLGQWAAVRAYLLGLAPVEANAAYGQLLRSLATTAADPQAMMQMQQRGLPAVPQVMERNVFLADDLLGLAGCAPQGLDREHIRSLAGMLQQAIQNGVVVEHVVERLATETARPKDQAVLTPRQAARLLADAGQAYHLRKFLPEPGPAFQDRDLEALNLLARHYLELHARDKKSPYLEKAWETTLNILALEGARDEKEDALRRAVELAPRIKEELGQAWLDQSYTNRPERGMEILATLGSMVSQGLQTNPRNQDVRLKGLQLQKSAVDALLKAAPARADEWQATLTLLAANWLREADYSRQFDNSTGLGARMRRDFYGNFYFINPDEDAQRQQMLMMQERGMPLALVTPEVLRCAPSEAWLLRVDSGLRPRIATVLAQLHLKIAEEDKAFPHIEALAPTHPDQARDLVKEFLRVWTRNHDPNAEKNMYRSNWIYFYGFESRAESIPLTRTKQERNLAELAGWVVRLRKLNLGDIDEEMLARAFTACHSSAEVYRTEAIEQVFGPLGGLKPKTLASLAQTMRGNLAGIWRLPAEQEKQKTKRKQKDIEIEVRRGYEVALQTVANGLQKFPDDWGLLCARAALLHDQVTYEQELAKSSSFSARRAAALELFQQAAERYCALVASQALSEDEETTTVYDQWFYASLGAVDLAGITEQRVPDLRQPALIRKAITSLPSEAAKRHMDKFANNLFTRMSSAKPQIKFRYLKGGFEIVDADHKQVAEARKVYDYYKDLVREIKLETTVDGSTTVGSDQPFGVFVTLKHTRDIERESGGFGRYLVNQNSLMFSYNYGRPTADYRDRFETAAKEALKEHFEVLSVTFQSENVNSRAHREYGWRVTPYAYILLKPRGPQVDKLPPLRLDLDFLDTSGFVVLPVESPAVPIDCGATRVEPRPLSKLQVTQTLDERQAAKGKLLLEIKATAVGLVGPLDQFLKLDLNGFDIVKTEDNGTNVSKFDDEGSDIAVISERNWLLTLSARDGQPAPPRQFRFASARSTDTEMTYQRYRDADVLAVSEEIPLEEDYGRRLANWQLWAGIGGAAAVILLALAGVLWLRRKGPVRHGPQLPATLTPFTVLDLLVRVRTNGQLTENQRTDLDHAIAEVEQHYFAAETNGKNLDLRRIASQWLPAAR